MGQEFEDAPERRGVSILFFTACPLSKLTYLPASVSQKRSISHSGYDDTEHLKIKNYQLGWKHGSEVQKASCSCVSPKFISQHSH